MSKFKKILTFIMLVLYVSLLSSGVMPIKADAKAAVPQIDFATSPVTEYAVGDRVRFDIYAPNYGGRVEYRVVLWEDSKKTYHDLWNSGNGYPSRYYTKWQPYGNNTFTLGWPIFEPGTYRITVYVKRIGIPNSKTALKGMNCDSYKESVAFVVKPKDVQITTLDKEGQKYGSNEITTPEIIKNDVKITAKNITFNNANIDGDLYISADNSVLNNINIKDTLFIDPGKDGSALINNVTAKNIKVLSGSQSSIHLKNTVAENLAVSSISKVRVQVEGATRISSTSMNSSAVLDNKGGTFGKVTISKGQNGKSEIDFIGNFSEPVSVNAESVIKTTENSNVAKLILSLENKDDIVVINGSYNIVEVSRGARIFIDGTVKKFDVKSKANIDISTNSIIEVLNKNGNDVSLSGDGKVIQTIGENNAGPITIPDGGINIPEPLKVEAVGILLSTGKKINATQKGGTNEYYVDLSSYDGKIGVRTSFTANMDCELEIMGLNFPLRAHIARVFGPSDFGTDDTDPPGVSLSNFRNNYTDLEGYVTQSVVIRNGTNETISIVLKMKVL